jgi:hypothetical protein
LEEIIIPEGVKVIGFGAFDGCEKLEKITLPKSLEEISLFAFSDFGSTIFGEPKQR